jgi:hypothetical protein
MFYKSYEFMPYYKCGDDLGFHVGKSKGDPAKALIAWAEQMEAGAKAARRIAEIIKGTKTGVQADTHHVSFDNLNRKTEKALAKDPAISVLKHKVEDED